MPGDEVEVIVGTGEIENNIKTEKDKQK